MAFSREGNGQCKVLSAELIDPRFSDVPQPAFEIMLEVQNEDGEVDSIYLEVSNRYGVGNNANKTQAQMTMESLMATGWQFGADFSQIGSMVGKTITYHAKKNSKGYINVYISNFAAKRINAAEAAQRVAAMTGRAAPAAVTTATAPAAGGQFAAPAAEPGAADNPFGAPAGAGGGQAGNPFA